METVKLYYEDAYLRRFEAAVVSCEPSKGGWAVVLDRTAFYPEGGGQPADHGTLSGVRVLDVHEKGGVISHTCDGPLPAGETVCGEIDWARRFDHMQQHSGEHIVSGMLCESFHCDNVGFHLGADTVIIDYNADISWESVQKVERLANEYIWADRPLQVLWPTSEELAALPYRSKKELTGAVRIVSFPGADRCACCGTHVSSAGQVGLVKFLSCQKFRDGVRLELVCGGRALRYLSGCWEQAVAAGQALSVKPLAVVDGVERIQRELGEEKARCAAAEAELFGHISREYAGQGDVLLFRPPMSSDGVRRLCDAVSAVCGGRCAVFAGEGVAYKYAVIHPDQDIRGWVKALNSALHGRGGGRDGFAQGSVQADEAAIRTFFAG
ncbi:MAG: alanyl-tRNA editing protein [Ruminococcaceae bacterium]|nr:alanyl-tRNA editing protein [Oscillospiraceae bacterium]